MELSKVISNRRSIREFNNKLISEKILKDILEHGIKSPSAKNRQPWHFIVVNNQDKKEEIGHTLLGKMGELAERTSNAIKDCSSLILVFADIENEIMDIQSVGACIENMLLRATDLEIGSLWIGFIINIEQELQKMFNCDKKLIAAISLGYTDTYPKKRPRKSLDEVCTWY